MKRLLVAGSMLALCYLGACFVAWDFPYPYEGIEPQIRVLWLIATGVLTLMAYVLAGSRKG
jgi:hypothetical protein